MWQVRQAAASLTPVELPVGRTVAAGALGLCLLGAVAADATLGRVRLVHGLFELHLFAFFVPFEGMAADTSLRGGMVRCGSYR